MTSGWRYRKKITLSNSGGSALTDYQVKFTLYRSSGTDNGFNIYVGNKCESDYKDIRFTKSDGFTLLNYWIESYDSNSAVIWVKIDNIPASGTAYIFLYYGNSSATNLSNGSNTFIFFDHFDGGSIDSSVWSYGGSVTVSNSIVTLDRNAGADVSLYTKNRMYTSKPKIIELKYQHPSRYRNRLYIVTVSGGGSPIGYDYGIFDPSIYWNGFTGVNLSINTWYIIKWEDTNSDYTWTIIDTYGNVVITRNRGSSIADTGYLTLLGTENDSSDFKIDWVRVREYTSTEPTVSSYGSEQQLVLTTRVLPNMTMELTWT